MLHIYRSASSAWGHKAKAVVGVGNRWGLRAHRPTDAPRADANRVWAALALLGAVGAVVAGGRGLWWLAAGPVLEEWVFRAGLHEALLRRAARLGQPAAASGGPALLIHPSSINTVVALGFAAAHLASHSPAWALATALPSLVVGALYRHGRQWGACALLHGLFNLVWLAAESPLAPQLTAVWESFA